MPEKNTPKAKAVSGSDAGLSYLDIDAAHHHVDSEAVMVVATHDGAGYAMWYGHAVREAFLAGIRWERSRSANNNSAAPSRITEQPNS